MIINNKHKAKIMILAWLMSFEVHTGDPNKKPESDEFFKNAWDKKTNNWKCLDFKVKDKYKGIKDLHIQPSESDIQGLGGKYIFYCFDDLDYANGHYFESFSRFMSWEWVEIPDEEIPRIKKFLKI